MGKSMTCNEAALAAALVGWIISSLLLPAAPIKHDTVIIGAVTTQYPTHEAFQWTQTKL
jgi:hypothetical protein